MFPFFSFEGFPYKEVYIFEGGLTPYLHWKAMDINCICLNLCQMLSKNYAIFLVGEGGGSIKDHIGSQGGGRDGQTKDRIIF